MCVTNVCASIEGSSITSKRKRGPTKLIFIHIHDRSIQVDFNEDGQAIRQGGMASGQYIG